MAAFQLVYGVTPFGINLFGIFTAYGGATRGRIETGRTLPDNPLQMINLRSQLFLFVNQLAKGVIPFIGLQILGMMLVWLMPSVATWLPKLLF